METLEYVNVLNMTIGIFLISKKFPKILKTILYFFKLHRLRRVYKTVTNFRTPFLLGIPFANVYKKQTTGQNHMCDRGQCNFRASIF